MSLENKGKKPGNLKLYDRSWFIWIELSVLYLAIPLLIVSGIIDLKLRWVPFAFIFLYVGGMLWILKPSLSKLGIEGNPLKKILAGAIFLGFVIILVLILLYSTGGLSVNRLLFYLLVLIVYPLISAPIQEVFFRSYFFYRYDNLASPYVVAILNILLFAFYHKIYGGWLAVWLSLIGGILLTGLFIKFRNYWYVWLCHGLLGVLVFVTGFGKYFTDLIK